MCHGDPGQGNGKIGPDLATSAFTLDQWINQVRFGSDWEGRPAKMAGYENKNMSKYKFTDEEVKEFYDYAQSAK